MTDADKKMLTEFLGECWHENSEQSPYFCIHCENSIRLRKIGEEQFEIIRTFLDFTDWRTTGRLIEKVGKKGKTICLGTSEMGSPMAYVYDEERFCTAELLQEAICAAVLAYLKEVE
jgi:hypothetical protein